MDEKEDTMLNRERENIVEETIKVNNNINEEQALKINNSIKEDKNIKNDMIKICLTIIVIIAVSIISILIIKGFMAKLSKNDNITTLPTITETVMQSYLKKDNIVKKFVGESNFSYNNVTYNKMILILAPNSFKKYMLILSNDANNYNEYGTYSISSNKIILKSNNQTLNELIVNNNTLTSFIDLKIMDTEMKSYKNNDKMLILNATVNANYGLYINKDEILLDKYTENSTNILVGNKEFIKNNNNIVIDNYTLEYVN